MNESEFGLKKKRIQERLARIGELAAKRGNEEAQKRLQEEIAQLLAGELSLVVCGEIKVGKSSLIGELLDLPGITPVDQAVATNAYIRIAYAETMRIVVYFTNADGTIASQDIFPEEIADWVSEKGNPNNVRRVTYLDIRLPHEWLREGLVIYDTPGLGGLNPEHRVKTMFALKYAHAVLFVGSAQEPLGDPQMAVLKDVYEMTKNVVYVMTHKDTEANWEERLRQDLDKIAATLGIERDRVSGCAISSTLKALHRKHGRVDLLAKSGFPELQSILKSLLEGREQFLLGRAVGRGAREAQLVLTPLNYELAARETKSKEEWERFQAELDPQLARAKELSKEGARWVQELHDRMDTLQSDQLTELDHLLHSLQTSLHKMLQLDEYVQDPARLSADLTAGCTVGFHRLLGNIEDELNVILTDLAAKTSLGLQGGHTVMANVDGLQVNAVMDAKLDPFLKKASDFGRSVTLNGMGVGAAGSVVGAIIGGVLGTVAGPLGTIAGMKAGAVTGATIVGSIAGLIGSIWGVGRGLTEVHEREIGLKRHALQRAGNDSLGEARIQLRHQLTTALRDARTALRMEILGRIAEEERSVQDSINGLKRASESQAAMSKEELMALKNDRKLLLQWVQQLMDTLHPPSQDGAAAA